MNAAVRLMVHRLGFQAVRQPPLPRTVGINALISATCLAALAITAATFSTATWHTDVALLCGGAIILTGLTPVRTDLSVPVLFTANLYFVLALSFIDGPSGAVAATVAVAVSEGWRVRGGMRRLLFNISVLLLRNTAGWFVFAHTPETSALAGAAAGTVAGVANTMVQTVLVTAAVAISTSRQTARSLLNSSVSQLPYAIGYGWAAYGAVLLYRSDGVIGISFSLVPALLVHLFLNALGRQVRQEQAERARHQREREALMQRVLRASDSERRRIARDLHDGVVQDLAVFAVRMDSAARRERSQGARDLAHRAAGAARGAMEELRTLLRQLTPHDIAETGLHRGLDGLVEMLSADGLRVHVHVDPDADTTAQSETLYRIIQEASRNTLRHANAQQLSIAVTRDGEHVELLLSDDGQGFSVGAAETARRDGHIGLQALQDLAAEAGGNLAIDSAPGAGTAIHARLPVSAGGHE